MNDKHYKRGSVEEDCEFITGNTVGTKLGNSVHIVVKQGNQYDFKEIPDMPEDAEQITPLENDTELFHRYLFLIENEDEFRKKKSQQTT